MGTRDSRIDAYVARSAPFAQPILAYLRELVHEACPAVEETMKWSTPYFTYHGMLCGMAAFKQHCALTFWKGAQVVEGDGESAGEAMGQFGRITSVEDLPPREVLAGYVRKAMALNESGAAPGSGRKPAPKPPLAVPGYLTAALAENDAARAAFEGFSPSHRREYVEWLTDAKGEETRKRRLATALEWMAEGKPRNWKYARPKTA